MIVYYRGGVQSKENQSVIPDHVMNSAELDGFSTKGLFKKKLRFFNDGLVIGSQEVIKNWLNKMKDQGKYLRRTKPILLFDGYFCSLRDQRSHFRE